MAAWQNLTPDLHSLRCINLFPTTSSTQCPAEQNLPATRSRNNTTRAESVIGRSGRRLQRRELRDTSAGGAWREEAEEAARTCCPASPASHRRTGRRPPPCRRRTARDGGQEDLGKKEMRPVQVRCQLGLCLVWSNQLRSGRDTVRPRDLERSSQRSPGFAAGWLAAQLCMTCEALTSD